MVDFVNRLNQLIRQVNSCSTYIKEKNRENALTIKETLRKQILNVFLEKLV